MNKRVILGGPPPRKRNDALVKSVFKEYIIYLLRFMYPDADELFDLKRGVDFMDKEFSEISTNRMPEIGDRIADLLVKVYLKNGEEKWLLIHFEVEAGYSEQIAYRLYQYHYRIVDQHNVDVETILICIGNENQKLPTFYYKENIYTSLLFKYHCYHIFDHSEEELFAMDNIIAFVVLALRKALLEGKVPDKELNSYRISIMKALIATGKYDNEYISYFIHFLKSIIFVRDPEENRKLETFINKQEGGTEQMGMRDYIKQEGREEGREEQKIEVVKAMLLDGFDTPRIVKLLKLSAEQVEEIKKDLAKG